MPAKTAPALASHLRVSIARMARRLRQEGQSEDATPSQIAALGTLFVEGPMTLGELAQAERVKAPTMTRIVAALEERGLARRDSSSDDGRVVFISITEAGRAAHEEFRRRRDEWLCRQMTSLDADERATLAKAAEILDRMREAP